MRILIAEDQPELRRMLVKNLTAAGYTVDGVPDGAEALAYLDAAAYDAAVLDIMMPKVDGLTVLRTLRARGSALPVLLLTARDAVADRVDGLDAGADDYLIKPFALDELLARLRVLTRKKGSGSTNVYTLADLTVDTAARTAKRGDRTLELSAREYALLEYLIRSKGVVLSRQQIDLDEPEHVRVLLLVKADTVRQLDGLRLHDDLILGVRFRLLLPAAAHQHGRAQRQQRHHKRHSA